MFAIFPPICAPISRVPLRFGVSYILLTGDRGFESFSLHQPVSCEPANLTSVSFVHQGVRIVPLRAQADCPVISRPPHAIIPRGAKPGTLRDYRNPSRSVARYLTSIQ
jgi:hypothetical protein